MSKELPPPPPPRWSLISALLFTQQLFVRDPYTDLYLLFIRESSEYAQYSYLFMAAPVRSAGICYSYRTLFPDLLCSVFSSYVFYRLNLVLLFISFVATCHSLKHVSVLPVSLRHVISCYCCCHCLSPTGYVDNTRSHKGRSP